MKKMAKVLFAVVIGLVFTISSAIADEIPFSGFLGNRTVYDRLKHSVGGGAKFRWFKPGVDFKKYNKFMVDSVIFYLANDADYKGIDPQDMKDLADSFNKELVAAFKGKYPIVADPGPDVLRIRLAITNIKPSKPRLSAATSIVPVGLAVSLVKKETTGGWTGSGETCAELMILDSSTNDAIAMAVDQRKAEFEQRFSKWGSANESFRFWSERIVMFLDYAKGIKRQDK
ncbi:MAG TPA: DUF3313 domain-containing protein [Deltaproteobacteria bacterium]|nr:DUF3313 domain-containing protein [Deltaproteobacteria bacterium]